MKAEKSFDAVRLMREIRDRMSTDMRTMSYSEKRAYIEQRAAVVRQELSLTQEIAGAR